MIQTRPITLRPVERETVEAGDYFSTERELYRVERVIDGRVLLEDCRTEALIEVGIEQALAMHRVRPSR